MSNITAEQAAADLRLAYLRRDEPSVMKLGNRLTALVARLLADQDTEVLDRLVQALGPLIQAADARGTEKPGTQWRRLAQLASMLRDHPQELEIQRWLHRDSVNGQLLRFIRKEPGITVKVLAKRADDRKINQVSNALRRLEAAGYIMRVSHGRFSHLYLSPLAERKLAAYDGRHQRLINEYREAGSLDTPLQEPVFSPPPTRAREVPNVQRGPAASEPIAGASRVMHSNKIQGSFVSSFLANVAANALATRFDAFYTLKKLDGQPETGGRRLKTRPRTELPAKPTRDPALGTVHSKPIFGTVILGHQPNLMRVIEAPGATAVGDVFEMVALKRTTNLAGAASSPSPGKEIIGRGRVVHG